MSQVEQTSLYVDLDDHQQLHLRYIAKTDAQGPSVLLVHGAVENGKIFYTESNKGFAPFLAEQGYRCYVLDLRGRGQSKPAISAGDTHGQTENIVQDIPASMDFINKHSGQFPRYWVAHSWGGVLLNSVFARNPHYIDKVKACVYFGSKRSLYNRHVERYVKGTVIWHWLAVHLAKKHGYLPARALKWGSDNETIKSHAQSLQWVKKKPWVDSDDGFDYGRSLTNTALPPILHVCGVKDKALAQAIDIEKFMAESGTGKQLLNKYGRQHGHHHDYGHIDMLTHPKARLDQFADALAWFQMHR